jgi:uncharacterized protein
MNKQVITFAANPTIEGNTLTGYAHVFGQRAEIRTKEGLSHYESFSKNAFDKALENSDVRAFYQHNPALLLGRQSSGTLQLEVTDEGLKYSIELPNTSLGADVKELINRGDLNQMSFGFVPDQFTWTKFQGVRERNHTIVRELVDVSPVSIPAFGGTSIQLRSFSFENESLRSQITRAKARLLK